MQVSDVGEVVGYFAPALAVFVGMLVAFSLVGFVVQGFGSVFRRDGGL